MRRSTLLLISQVYVPDPASVGQHLHDAAAEVAARGYPVRVLASARGYDAPEICFPLRETRDGVQILRLPLSSLGKRSLPLRVAAQLSFLAQALVRGLLTPRLGAVLVSTSPPMCAAAGLVISLIRRVPLVYWVMDINPDQAVALGAVRQNSLCVRVFEWFNRAALAQASSVVTLDRFMAHRLLAKRHIDAKLEVLAPWPHDDHLETVPHDQNPFRSRHSLDGKFVVMYSGNHSPANPITTVLRAAERLRHRKDVVFLFVGGGAAKRDVEAAIAAGAQNVLSLPYQPLADLKYSLSAADVHVVTLGPTGVGIVHPCKIYGAMAVARPILAVCPRPSHVSDLLDRCDFGRQIGHGDVDQAVAAIEELAAMAPAQRAALGQRARQFIQRDLSKQILCTRFGDLVEDSLAGRPRLHVYDPRQQAPTAEPAAEPQPARRAA